MGEYNLKEQHPSCFISYLIFYKALKTFKICQIINMENVKIFETLTYSGATIEVWLGDGSTTHAV